MTMTASITPEPTPRDGLHGPEAASTVESGAREGRDAPAAPEGRTAAPGEPAPVYDRRAWETYHRDAKCGCTAPDPADCALRHGTGAWLCVCHYLSGPPVKDTDPPGQPLALADDGSCSGVGEETEPNNPNNPADRRQQYADALAETLARADGWEYAPGLELRDMSSSTREHYNRLADAVLAVRDAEVDDLCQRLATQGVAAHDMTVRLGQAEAELEQARAELARRDAAESADAAAGSYAGRAEQAEAALERVTGARLCDDCRITIRALDGTEAADDA